VPLLDGFTRKEICLSKGEEVSISKDIHELLNQLTIAMQTNQIEMNLEKI
jgi:hypothetical protein